MKNCSFSTLKTIALAMHRVRCHKSASGNTAPVNAEKHYSVPAGSSVCNERDSEPVSDNESISSFKRPGLDNENLSSFKRLRSQRSVEMGDSSFVTASVASYDGSEPEVVRRSNRLSNRGVKEATNVKGSGGYGEKGKRSSDCGKFFVNLQKHKKCARSDTSDAASIANSQRSRDRSQKEQQCQDCG